MRRESKLNKLSAIDLFAGAGGLSLGFLQTECFDIKVAVECNKHAKDTYLKNHGEVEIIDNIYNINYKQLIDKHGNFDVVIGGPPCQGFSNANRQRNNLVSTNNQLVNEYIKAIQELKPKAFVMENVKTINSDTHKFFYCDKIKQDIKELNIHLCNEVISISEASILPQVFIDLLKSSNQLNRYLIGKDYFVKINSILKNAKDSKKLTKFLEDHKKPIEILLKKWDYIHNEYWCEEYKKTFLEIKALLIEYMVNGSNYNHINSSLKAIVENQKAINKIQEIRDNDIILDDVTQENNNICIHVKTYNIINYVLKKFRSLGYQVESGVVNATNFGVPQNRERFIIIGIKNDISDKKINMPTPILNCSNDFYTIGDALKDIEIYQTSVDVENKGIKKIENLPLNPLQTYLNDNELVLYNHINTNTRETARERFKNLKQGQNFHDLVDNLKSSYSDPTRTQNTIYLRLNYNIPSGTVVNVRKSMWIHPVKDRAISIREAARLQSFPDSFIFCGTKDSQYQQVGNAVPPLLGRAIAEKILELLELQPKVKLADVILRNKVLNENAL